MARCARSRASALVDDTPEAPPAPVRPGKGMSLAKACKAEGIPWLTTAAARRHAVALLEARGWTQRYSGGYLTGKGKTWHQPAPDEAAIW